MNIPNKHNVLLGLLFLFSFSYGFTNSIPWLSANLERVQQQAEQEDKLFFVYFSADWCMPCKWMEQNTFQDSELSAYIKDHYLAVKVDLNLAKGKELQHQFEVEVIPTVLVFATNGRLIARHSASQEARPFLRWLKRLDKPSHHVDAQLPLAATPTALSSPKPNTSFSRPALIPETAMEMEFVEQSLEEEKLSPALVLSGHPIAAAEPYFAPRSSLAYGVRLAETSPDYSEAVHLIGELERKFEQRAELEPTGDGSFNIILGAFETTGKARQFLLFLNRNNRSGEIVPVAGK